MDIGVMKWPGGRWIADRSQQGFTGKHLTLGPVQFNWVGGFRIYLTWPVALCFYAHRKPQGVPIPSGLREGP